MNDPILVSGYYTLLFDIVVEEMGLKAALVYGQIYRHCKMKNHICYASIKSMAKLVGISSRRFGDYLASLVKEGYITHITPDLVGYSHKCKITDKVLLSIKARNKLSETLPEETGDGHIDVGVSQGDTGVSHTNGGIRQIVTGGYDSESQGVRQDVVQGDNIGDNLEEEVKEKRGKEEREFSFSKSCDYSEDLHKKMNESQEGNNRYEMKDIDNTPLKRFDKENSKVNNQSKPNEIIRKENKVVLSEKQRIVLETLGNAMHLNFTLHRDGPKLADFLIIEYGKRHGPNNYAGWAITNGMHKGEMSKYAAFPVDVIAEYPQAFRENYWYSKEDDMLFQNELKDFPLSKEENKNNQGGASASFFRSRLEAESEEV